MREEGRYIKIKTLCRLNCQIGRRAEERGMNRRLQDEDLGLRLRLSGGFGRDERTDFAAENVDEPIDGA